MSENNSSETEPIFGRVGRYSIKSTGLLSGLRVGSLLRIWAEVSKINFMSTQPLDVITSGQSLRRRSIGLPVKDYSIQNLVPIELRNKSADDLFIEQFPTNVTSLMNEDQLWGCFYIFPELYEDMYSPVVKIRNIENVPEPVEGVLTRDMVAACLSYLKRTPILGEFVYIKLDLSSKNLINVEVLQHYKYLVYLDLSSNLLTELTVLSHLPYLQFLSVAFNRLGPVLDYDTPQWFLTEVHYKFNSIKRIRDLSAFWSITILDLSHNNINGISGLETLRYLRRLDLSFNHILRLENLNHLRLIWLDLSYNNISSFELGPRSGLWTLLHLEYLNLNENSLTSMRIFSDCTRLRELHVRNNRLSMLLELAVYMQQMRRVIVLDLRGNPVCSSPNYKDVVINTFPSLLCFDAVKLDPVEQRSSKIHMSPDVTMFATRRLLRELYIEQLSRAHVSPFVPPADTTEVPIIVLVGYAAVGKGTLARRLASECSSNIVLARQHTTATYQSPDHYIKISRSKFDDMLLAGEFLTYSEMYGESYGLSREEAFIKDGKVRIVSMDLLGALMLKLRGRRPYLILASFRDKPRLNKRQQNRRTNLYLVDQQRMSLYISLERSNLQVLLSERIVIKGIINEMLLCLSEKKERSQFLIESECSFMKDNETRKVIEDNTFNTRDKMSLEDRNKSDENENTQVEQSIYSVYKRSKVIDDYVSYGNEQNSYQDRNSGKKEINKSGEAFQPENQTDNLEKHGNLTGGKNIDSSYASSTYKNDHGRNERSANTKLPAPSCGKEESVEDLELWVKFLIDTGLTQTSGDLMCQLSEILTSYKENLDSPDSMIHHMAIYKKTPCETETANVRDDYENIHRQCPGMFWDTVTMDNPDEAFYKVRRIIKDIVNSQNLLKPMFDIDFANSKHYPTVQKRVKDILIAPQQLFH